MMPASDRRADSSDFLSDTPAVRPQRPLVGLFVRLVQTQGFSASYRGLSACAFDTFCESSNRLRAGRMFRITKHPAAGWRRGVCINRTRHKPCKIRAVVIPDFAQPNREYKGLSV